MSRWKARLFGIVHSRYFPYILLIFLPLVLFRPVVLGQNVFALGDFSGSDLLELHLPFKSILHEAYTHGQFPLWSPYLSNGFPVLAEGQSGPLYPPHILLAFLSPVLSLNYSILISFMIAGCGMYTFARTLPLMGKRGALASAIIFMFGSFFVARLKHINMIAVAAYLPWCFWLLRRYFTDFNLSRFVWLGIVWGLQVLAGHPHMFYFSVIMCLWLISGELFLLYMQSRKKVASTSLTLALLKTIIGVGISGVVAIGLAAAQLLPTYELTALSSRQDFSYEVATAYPLRPHFLATLFAPFFLGNPATGSYRGDIQLDGIWWENVLYIGLLPLVLVVVLLFFRIRNRKTGEFLFNYYFRFYVLSAVLFFILSMGSYSFLFSVLYYNIPGMTLFRFPTRFNLLTLLSLSVLAGWAIERLFQRLERSRIQGNLRKEDSSDYVFSWPFSPTVTTILILGVILLDLSVFADQYIGYYPVGKYLAVPESVKELQKKDSYLYRIYPMTQYMQNPFGALGWKKGEKAIFSLQKAIPGNFAALYHMYSFTDRGWFEGGLGLKERAFLENFLTKNNLPGSYLSRILGLWNVKYIYSFSDFPSPNFLLSQSYTLDSSFGVPLQVYKNEFVQPRAFFVSDIRKRAQPDAVLTELLDPAIAPEKYAYSETIGRSDEKEASSSSNFDRVSFNKAHSVSIVDYQSTMVSMKTESRSEAYLVFSDTYYPGWKAYIDGKENPILKVNLVMRAVKVPPGSHTVIWAYEPIAFYVGSGISFATLVTLLTYFILRQIKKGRADRGMVAAS